MPLNSFCPCCSGKCYKDCCMPYLDRSHAAPNPEALMRSRYTAYAKQNTEYLYKTSLNPKEQSKQTEVMNWWKLEILQSSNSGTEGFVEFKASYETQGELRLLHEKSRFVFHEPNGWLYADGIIVPAKAVSPGRNEPCWCGSTNKFKKCHG